MNHERRFGLMNKIYGVAVAAMFVAASTFPVLAVEPSGGTGGGAPKMQQKSGAEVPQAAKAGGPQRVTGSVTDINSSKGLVTLTSSDRILKLHFPPQSVRDLKKGDRITAQYAFTKAGMPAGSTQAYDAPKGAGEHRMTGTISNVDHEKGWLHVKTDQVTLELYFPPEMVRDLKEGDRITVDLAFSKGA